MKMCIARPSKYKPFYRLETPFEMEIAGEIYKSPDQKEVEFTEEEVQSMSKITLDFLELQSKLGFLYSGPLDIAEHTSWKEI